MPKIPTYDSPEAQRGIQPSDIGASSFEQMGRRVGQSFHQIGEDAQQIGNVVEQHEAMADTSRLSPEAASTFSFLTDSLNKAYTDTDPADPAGPDVKQKWIDNVLEPTLESFGQDVQSRHGAAAAQDLRDRLRMEFTKSASGAQSSFDENSVHTNLTTTGYVLGNAVRTDPSKLDAAMGVFNETLDAQLKAHPVTAEQAAAIRTEIGGQTRAALAEAAARGSIEQNPKQFLADLQDGKYSAYLSGEETAQLSTAANAAQRLQVEQQKAQDTELRRQQKEKADTAANAVTTGMIREDGSLQVPKDYYQNVTKLALMPGAEPGLVRSMIDMGRSVTRELAEGTPTVTDPHTYQDMSNRLTLTAGDPKALTDQQVIQARADGRLSDKDYNFFKGALGTLNRDPAYRAANDQFKTFMSGIKSSITKSNILMGNNDAAGDQRFLQFSQTAREQFEAAYKSGKWHDLLDRNKTGSLWLQAKPYMTDIKGSQADLIHRAQDSVGLVPSVAGAKRNAGESAGDFLKRTGGQ